MGSMENKVQGKWLEIKGEVLKSWGKLTSDDLDQTKGDMMAIGGLIQQKYGEAQESYDKKLSGIFSRYQDKKEDSLENVKDKLKDS